MIIKASHAILEPGRVLRDVRLQTEGAWIYSVSSGPTPFAQLPDIDCGDAVLTPGLVNPHSHLELEFCRGQVQFGGSFVGWLQQVRDMKQAHGGATAFPAASLAELAAGGCTTVVDHHATQLDWDRIAAAGLRYVPLREFFEFNNGTPDLAAMRSAAHRGFAAHATYTTSSEVARACRTLADETGLPLSIHLSEFRGEVEFIRDGRNAEVAELLARAGAADPDWRGAGCSPVQYAAELGLLDGPTYAIHVNYLEPGDLDVLAARKPTVVFCPRSHRYFGHPRHPVAELLAAGVPVALGTDSLASNDCLAPLREAALVRRDFPAIPAATVCAAITTTALGPLGWERQLGRLVPGCRADLAVFPLDGDPGGDFECVFDAVVRQGRSALTLCDGKVIHAAPEYRRAPAVAAMAGGRG